MKMAEIFCGVKVDTISAYEYLMEPFQTQLQCLKELRVSWEADQVINADVLWSRPQQFQYTSPHYVLNKCYRNTFIPRKH